ncbi:putative arylsulfatase protein [Neofusicoccum parvum UCRNP2]|uniref:Putative arylsulfatase protein n=1 Tax=Botryosphaeria parva (strain UCR-NP2) TaxID=1287680 RepID=R1GZT0_BOTPV|nr:putative arylsulfatase protein [Neofusicoccum parvum UCRNP2]
MISRLLFAVAVAGLLFCDGSVAAKKPNIVMIMSDDQDYRLGSLDYQDVVNQEIIDKGVLLTKHFVTTAQCCPSRVSFHRGQMAHNTNHTDVRAAGGGYSKFLASGEDEDYLPHWLKNAGYQTEFPKPKGGNFNPNDNFTEQKVSWLRNLTLLDDEQINRTDEHYRHRLRALKGLDEIVHDVVKKLNETGALDNTYVIYTTDNGYHLGNHRVPAGKSLPYIEDTNIPMAIRGPGIPPGKVSKTPSTHVDMVPTFLDIAGLAAQDRPSFLDGRSLLDEWQNPMDANTTTAATGTPKEIINIEFWGGAGIEGPVKGRKELGNQHNSYKTLRIVGEKSAWLFSRWCTHETELYDTINDPYELTNLARNSSHEKLVDRLNALLLVTKSCGASTCRNPWSALRPGNGSAIHNLDDAMDPAYDDFFASDRFPDVDFGHCMEYQYVPNEMPFFPEGAVDLGGAWREPTDDFIVWEVRGASRVKGSSEHHGNETQRHATLQTIMETAKNLTDGQLGVKQKCDYKGNCVDA